MISFLPALAVFLGSFLLFGIQPMLGRTLLPSFGGSAAVWTVCLASYQTLLLAGYFYAHVVSGRPRRTQAALHAGLLALAVAWTAGFAFFRPELKAVLGTCPWPALEVLFCVLLFAGLPYVMLAAGSTLVQAWLAGEEVLKSGSSKVRELSSCGDAPSGLSTSELPHSRTSRNVYRLYAVSNLGSLSGLLVYPFLLEPYASLNAQWWGFAASLLIYALLLAVVAKTTVLRPPAQVADCGLPVADCPPSSLDSSTLELPDFRTSSGLPLPLARPWLWFALPALSTFILNAVTMHLTTDVTPVPLLWVLLLTAFLLSYVAGFSAVGEKGVIVWAAVGVLSLAFAGYASGLDDCEAFLPKLTAACVFLWACCTFLHGWLCRIRPETARLTRFYLGIAAGGAAGGVCASLVAPVIFTGVWEYPLVLLATAGMAAWFIRTWWHPELKGLNGALLGVCALAAVLTLHSAFKGHSQTVCRTRNFYGCLRVSSYEVETALEERVETYEFCHGATLHGVQARDPRLRRVPTSYYGPAGGGLALGVHPKFTNGVPMRVGLIGLGVGTLACYGRTNDLYRFYEINPAVVRIASDTNYFTFLSDSAATVEVKLGDARKSLEAERGRSEPRYDVLYIDAYSGDSIPYHLATKEAFRLYRDRLAPDGILAVHVSNWHIDLLPLCKAMAKEIGFGITGILSRQTEWTAEADWVFMTRAGLSFSAPNTREIAWDEVRAFSSPADEEGSLVGLFTLADTRPVKKLAINIDALMRPR